MKGITPYMKTGKRLQVSKCESCFLSVKCRLNLKKCPGHVSSPGSVNDGEVYQGMNFKKRSVKFKEG